MPAGAPFQDIVISYNPHLYKMLEVPFRVNVDLFSLVRWIVRFDFDMLMNPKGFHPTFEIYFDNGRSPFKEWSRKKYQINQGNKIVREDMIALGRATRPGDFKYGIKVWDPVNEISHDEDPYLRVQRR